MTLEIYSSPSTSFFLRHYLSINQLDICLYYIVNISTCIYSFWLSYINRLWAWVSFISLSQTYLKAELKASISSSSISHSHISITFTMKDSKNYHVLKLKRSKNYESWKKNIISVLKVKDLWMIILKWLKKLKASKFNASTADTFSTTLIAFISTTAAFILTAAVFVALTTVRKEYVIAAYYWMNKNDRVCDMIIKELNHSKQSNFKFIQNYVDSFKWITIRCSNIEKMIKSWLLSNLFLLDFNKSLESYIFDLIQSIKINKFKLLINKMIIALIDHDKWMNEEKNFSFKSMITQFDEKKRKFESNKFQKESNKICSHCKQTSHD